MIEEVAIFYKGELYTLKKPNRHHDIINLIHEKTGDENIVGIQGFIHPDSGRFLKRTEAMIIARELGQVGEKTINGKQLFSEDLW